MTNIIYDNDSSVMQFDYSDVTKQLSLKIDEYNVDDDVKLLEWLNKQSNGKEAIKIGEDHVLISRFCYLICDLIDNRKGKIFCKVCSRAYKPDQIIKESTSPFDRRVSSKTVKELNRFFRKEFGTKGKTNIPGSGGKTYQCPKGHCLVSVRTWIS